jgi:UDP-N-acetylglucosamine 2-epimerase (non-hydrolysing)
LISPLEAISIIVLAFQSSRNTIKSEPVRLLQNPFVTFSIGTSLKNNIKIDQKVEDTEMLVSIVGTRPNLVKLAPIFRAAQKEEIEHHIIHTGQHYDYELSQIFFEELELPAPHKYLEVGSGSATYQIGETIKRVAETLQTLSEPAFVLVYGDTNATVGAALGAKKCNFMVGHVESGIRTGYFQHPEELNRIIAETCADVLFAPTRSTYANIQSTDRAVLSGDVMHDTLCWAEQRINKSHLEKHNLTPKEYYLVTLHRGKNVDNPNTLYSLLDTLASTGEQFLFPAHPRTQKTLRKLTVPTNIQITPPLGYLSFLSLMKFAKKVITDSGGAQKEAYSFGVPCVTILDFPVWQETVDAGWTLPVGLDLEKIKQGILGFWPRSKRPPVFGDGQASQKIIQTLVTRFESLLK